MGAQACNERADVRPCEAGPAASVERGAERCAADSRRMERSDSLADNLGHLVAEVANELLVECVGEICVPIYR